MTPLAPLRQVSRDCAQPALSRVLELLLLPGFTRRQIAQLPLVRFALAGTLLLGVWHWSQRRAYEPSGTERNIQVATADFAAGWPFAKSNSSPATISVSRTELALHALEAYHGDAAQESRRFGIDLAALLATAIWEAELRADGDLDIRSAFPLGLAGTPLVERNAFREMTLAVLYELGERTPRTQGDWIRAIAAQYPDPATAASAIQYRIDRYLL